MKTNKAPVVAITELTLYVDSKNKKMGRVFKVFNGDSEAQIKSHLQYYCQKYGILEAKTMSKEEYESQKLRG